MAREVGLQGDPVLGAQPRLLEAENVGPAKEGGYLPDCPQPASDAVRPGGVCREGVDVVGRDTWMWDDGRSCFAPLCVVT